MPLPLESFQMKSPMVTLGQVGVLVGVFVGVFVGVSVGVIVGVLVGVLVGVSVGVAPEITTLQAEHSDVSLCATIGVALWLSSSNSVASLAVGGPAWPTVALRRF